MSKLETNTIDTVSGTTNLTIGSTNTSSIALGASGDTITVPNGAMSGQNYPAFKVYLTSTQNISAATETTLEFNNEDFDLGGYFNTTTYRYTPPAGKYCFISAVGNVTVESYLQGRIRKNGDVIAETLAEASNGARFSISVIVDADGTDYFYMTAQTNTASQISAAQYRTYFGAFRIGS